MAIANIVCRSGVGPSSAIKFFVTHGLGVGAAAPVSVNFSSTFPNITSAITLAVVDSINFSSTFPNISLFMTFQNGVSDTHDGLPRYFGKDYLRKIKEFEAKLAVRETEKLAEKQLLRQQLEELFHPSNEEKTEDFSKEQILSEEPILEEKQIIETDLLAQLRTIEYELKMIHEEALRARSFREEEDIKTIMMALEAPFSAFKKTIH